MVIFDFIVLVRDEMVKFKILKIRLQPNLVNAF